MVLTGGGTGNPYLFAGRRFDSETGLYYYRARVYSPELGRFLQTDPIGYADGINWYLDCGNNPIILIDPWGLGKRGGYNYWSALSSMSGLWGGYSDDVDAHYLGMVTAPRDYYRAFRASGVGQGESVVQAANMTVGKVFGYATLAEGIAGVDVRGVRELSTGERAWRIGTGAVQTAASAVAVANTLHGIAGSGAAAVHTPARAREMGRAGEAAVRSAYDIGPKRAISIHGRTRVADGWTERVLTEVKNRGHVSYTQQLRDFTSSAAQNSQRLDLYVRPATTLSGPMQAAIDSGAVNMRYIPGM